MKKSTVLLTTALVTLLFCAAANAQFPQLINYQGILNDPDTGNPISESTSMTFAIYDAETAGTLIWSETQTVDVAEGYFNVLLGSATPLNPAMFKDGLRYLGVKIGNDPEMTPRKPIAGVGYALTSGISILAGNAAKLGGKAPSEYISISGPAVGNSSEPILSVTNDGNGRAAYFLNHDNVSGSSTVEAITFGTGGSAGIFHVTTTSNMDPALKGRTIGGGPGVEGTSVSGNGLQGSSTGGYGVLAQSNNSHSVYVPDAGAAGVFIKDAGSHGVDIVHANGSGVQVFSAGENGLRVVTAGLAGLRVDSAGGSGVHVASAGNDGVRVESANWSGVYVASAGGDALRVQTAGVDGLRIFEGVGRDYIRAGSDADLDFRVTNSGAAYADGGWQGAADFAELIETDGNTSSFEAGDVLSISADEDRAVTLSWQPYSTSVIGVYSTKPGFVGTTHPVDERRDTEVPVAITGIVPCKVSAENGAIRRGDLLTTARTPGYAMKATDPRIGTVLGKAMQALESGKGAIEILVILQ